MQITETTKINRLCKSKRPSGSCHSLFTDQTEIKG